MCAELVKEKSSIAVSMRFGPPTRIRPLQALAFREGNEKLTLSL